MSLTFPLNPFLKVRYRFMFAGLLTVIIHGIITSFYLSHYFLQKYGVGHMKISPNDMNMWNDCEKIMSESLLFYPIITVLVIVAFFFINKQKKELRVGLLLYLISTILVFIYLSYFSQTVVLYILPVLMIIGAISSYRGEYHEASRIFVLLFVILLLGYGADKLSVKFFSFEPL